MTMDCHSAPAALAFAAICEGQTCYPLANPEAADAGADFANFAAKFMAHNRPLRHADTILARMEVGPANATVMNFEYDLARTGRGFGRINYGHFILTLECCRLHYFSPTFLDAHLADSFARLRCAPPSVMRTSQTCLLAAAENGLR